MGFGIPIDLWLKNDLKIWPGELFKEKVLFEHENLFKEFTINE